MAKPKQGKHTAGLFRDEYGEIVTAIPVERTGDTVTLLYDYPPDEFCPAPGWTVKGRGFALRITAKSGRVLTCEPLTGGE